ncbi:MAG: DUF192 domain-containing protein [Thaumarchaeota archaeon]|nr:DUF192 domain-containing protein [Nitrososphaerota archaeon]
MNLKTPHAILGIALIAVVAAYLAYAAFSPPAPVTLPVPSRFLVNGRTFAITYTATTPAERQAGLMNRAVTNTTAMLFVFPSAGVYRFWMYDTNASLDMIWISVSGQSGQVTYLYTDAQPCFSQLTCPTFGPNSQADYVIEAQAGFAKSNGIQIGATIQFMTFTLVPVS